MTESAQSVPGAQTWKLTLAYDGTDFHGWQIQPGQVTIQGQLQDALGRITGEIPLPQGSGRTDAGVHALGQVASFSLAAPIPVENLIRALNRTLPTGIRILDARIVPSTFHARHSARAKMYEYRILRERNGLGNVCPPFLARYVSVCSWPIEFAAIEQAAGSLIGTHDFFSFAATDPDRASQAEEHESDAASTIRTIYSSCWEELNSNTGPMLIYRVCGSGFLHHMVRNLVGTMLEVGRGQLQVADIPAILAAHSRSAAGPTAPARGLYLHSVEYDEPVT